MLWLHIPKETEIQVGALGAFRFIPGLYAYVGSAQAGLHPRLARHVRLKKKLKWHIDYLRAKANLVSVMAVEAEREEECRLAATLAALPGATVPVHRFGASDCRCPAHLFYFAKPPEVVAQPALLHVGMEELLPDFLAEGMKE